LNDRIAELVTGNLDHDFLKFGRSNKPIVIGIKEPKCLPDSFSPEPLEELGEFLESDDMVTTSFTEVQLDPVAVVVEGCCQRYLDLNVRISLAARLAERTALN
jgi:hypothetical protein